jgi:hypothetical protein
MRVNISKSKFFAEQIEYLGYWIIRQGIQSLCIKVVTILNIKAPNTREAQQTYASLLVLSTIIATFDFAEVSF